MEYLPSTLKVLHLGVAGLGLYVSIEGQEELDPFVDPEETTNQALTGFSKSNFMFSAYIVTIIALVQLAVLFYFHNYGAKESHFRVTYFVLAMINIIFGSYLLQGAVTLLRIPEGAEGAGTGQVVHLTRSKDKDVAVGAAVLGALVITFNFVNIYHASYARGGNDGLRITPRRK
tara:strand:+ start:982 stop:1503 length:522 start_codon:yes stop_codon:yes gene_type:complete